MAARERSREATMLGWLAAVLFVFAGVAYLITGPVWVGILFLVAAVLFAINPLWHSYLARR